MRTPASPIRNQASGRALMAGAQNLLIVPAQAVHAGRDLIRLCTLGAQLAISPCSFLEPGRCDAAIWLQRQLSNVPEHRHGTQTWWAWRVPPPQPLAPQRLSAWQT